jgi:cysteine synthase A
MSARVFENDPTRSAKKTPLTIIYHLLREEGLFLGLSSGINVAGALRFGQERGPGQTIVTILCDSEHKYLSTLLQLRLADR